VEKSSLFQIKNKLRSIVKPVETFHGLNPGLPDFSSCIKPKPEKCTKGTQIVPNGHKISQMAVKYSKWPQNISTFSNLRPSKRYPNWDFWFENKPSGNPA
jgi:hypothetical protein